MRQSKEGKFETMAELAVSQSLGGFATVGNVGNFGNWTGNVFAQANMYAYGKMTWDPIGTTNLAQMSTDWAELTFGLQIFSTKPEAFDAIYSILDRSWEVFEGYYMNNMKLKYL